jgi:hypothetical protein
MKFFDQVRHCLRVQHYAIRTKKGLISIGSSGSSAIPTPLATLSSSHFSPTWP